MTKRQLIFQTLYDPWWLLFCATAVLLAVVLIFVLLRYERRLVSRTVGYSLLGLRLTVALIVFLALLEPVLSLTLDRERTGRILIGLDLSESMGTIDTHATKAERLRWARALGMIGNDTINARLDRWLAEFDAGKEPEWVSEDEVADPEQRQKLAQIRKENLDGIFRELDKISRKEIALRLLTKTTSPLLPQLSEIANVEIIVFAGKAESVDDTTLESFVAEPPDTILVQSSNLSQGLVASNMDSETSPIIGVILFTDGRDNSGRNPVGLAARLKDIPVPIYPVLVGSEFQPKDLAISTLDYPQTAFKDDNPLLKATLYTSGFEGDEITVVLERRSDGDQPPEIIESKLTTPVGATTTVEFKLDAEDVGRYEYTVRTEVKPGETREDNNSQDFAMNVVDDRSHVLLLEEDGRWEFRFIHNALDRDERVDCQKVVFDQPYIGILNSPFFPRQLKVPDDADDLANSPFAEMDMVIVGDISPQRLNETAWKLLEHYVAESGGTLVMIAGKRYFPLAYQSPIVAKMVPFTNLKPVNMFGDSNKASPAERGFQLRLTGEGEQQTILQFDVDPEENRRIWNSLPGHMWALMGQAKPGANVFAYAVIPGEEVSLEHERRRAVVVQQHYGAGQILWMGINSTWRWRHRMGDEYHHRYWGQLARWAASYRAGVGNEFVKFGPEKIDIEVGDDAVVRARWARRFLKDNPDLKATAEIYRDDGKPLDKPFSTVDLTPSEGNPLTHQGRAVSLPAGTYQVKLVVDGADLGADEIITPLYVHQQRTLELSNLSSNRALLTQIATASNGRLFLPNEVSEIPDMFRMPLQSITERKPISLWDHWLILILLFGLLTAEWVVRKLNGLP